MNAECCRNFTVSTQGLKALVRQAMKQNAEKQRGDNVQNQRQGENLRDLQDRR